MMKMQAGVTTWFEFVKESLSDGQTVGIDFTQYPAGSLETRSTYFGKSGISIKSIPNLVDIVWGDKRPARSTNEVTVLAVEFAGKSSMEKQDQIAKKLEASGVDAYLMTTLDDICWFTNLRGTDIEYNPVFFSYALFYPKRSSEESRITLFVQESKVAAIGDYLASCKIEVKPYEAITAQLEELNTSGVKVGYDGGTCNAELHRLCKDVAVKTDNVVANLKVHKNETEMQGMRASNIRDCAAIMKYFAFLEEELKKPDHGLDEFKAAMILNEIRTHGQYH